VKAARDVGRRDEGHHAFVVAMTDGAGGFPDVGVQIDTVHRSGHLSILR